MKRWFCLFLTLIMMLSLLPCCTLAAGGTWVCPNCGNISDGNYCPNDGMPRPSGWVCSRCGSNNGSDALYCTNCGKRNDAGSFSYSAVNVHVGDIVQFGTYPTTKYGGKEQIRWQVLEVSGNEALLISKYVLEAQPYNKTRVETTWETCTLRTWLNDTFFNKAFSSREQSAVLLSAVTADKNPEYGTYAGNDTYDRVFLLSAVEAERYFGAEDRRCPATPYALENGAFKSDKFFSEGRGTCYWWLRSPGANRDEATDVRTGGLLYSRAVNLDYVGVRPVIRVDLNCGLF